MSKNEFKLWGLIVLCFVLIMFFAHDIGVKRAEEIKECYKSAQVNRNIKCDVEK